MINDFIVQAYPEENLLKVILNGFFMESEIELALQLAKNEAEKLKPDFNVFVDIHNLKVAHKNYNLGMDKMKKILKLLGAGNMHLSGSNLAYKGQRREYVGLYPHKNEWFFS